MRDITLALMTGVDIPIPECRLVLHQPNLKEISMIGEKNYFIGAQCLCISKSALSQDNSLLSNITNFQVFMMIMSEIKEEREITIEVLQLLFPDYSIMFISNRTMVLKHKTDSEADIIPIEDEEFEILQKVFKRVFCFDGKHTNQQSYDPADSKAKEIADKIMKSRQRLAEEKGQSDSDSIITQYVSSLTVGVNSLGLQELINFTLFQLYDIIERFGLYISWDLDIRSRLAGAKGENQPENWMKNIH